MIDVVLPTLHADQVKAFWHRQDLRATDPTCSEADRALWARNGTGRRVALRCGRRWGKTTYGGCRASDGALKSQSIGWFAPDYKKLSEAYEEIKTTLKPVLERSSKIEGVIRTINGGRIDFWTLNDPHAGRSRFYHGVVIDEGAFTNNGPIEDSNSMLSIWEKAIEPTLFDYQGWALVASNTNGENPENFLYAVCNDPKWGFISYHAPTINNPLLPIRLPGESPEAHMARRMAAIEEIRERTHPLVFRQEYLAEFVDWSGVAFFDPNKWLVDGQPVPLPGICDLVCATIDTAVKTGSANDGTAVIYWAVIRHLGTPRLVILDYDLVQIEGALLETWLPTVVANLEDFALKCRARGGSMGVWIENKASGEVLLQQAHRRGMRATAIDSRLTAMGKDERAISVSGYHYRGEVKICREAYDKVLTYKGSTRNHLVSQVTGFRIGDKDAAKRADDLLDTYCYGLALGLGDAEGF